ncbi:hypothetical protein, partial [Streptomyces sp. NPDC057545]|uniref:hypothetical protein n=1 Tax=Streptomyces sp. NPDC057545 TaxID=3346164 RepID=UPI0036C11BC0
MPETITDLRHPTGAFSGDLAESLVAREPCELLTVDVLKGGDASLTDGPSEVVRLLGAPVQNVGLVPAELRLLALGV